MKIFRSTFRELSVFHNMATALVNENTTRLLFPLFLLVVLAAANPLSNNETTLMPTSYSMNETVLLGIEDSSYDNETVLPTSRPYSVNETELIDLVGPPRYFRIVLVPIPCPIDETELPKVTDPSGDNETTLLLATYPSISTETKLLNVTDATSDNETVLLPTPSICFKNVTMLLNVDPSSDNKTALLTTPSTCFGNETVLQDVLGPSSDNETELLPTSRPCVKETVPVPPPSPYFNNVTLETECTNTSILVYMNFSRPFQGVIYPRKNLNTPLCSFFSRPSSNDTEVILELPFNSCGTKFRENDDFGVRIFNSIIIQQHQMIPTRFDLVRNVSCMLEIPLEVVRPSDFIPVRLPLRRAVPWLEVCVGSDLFPTDEFRPEGFIESALYIVVKVADRRVNRDMVVRNCIAHDRRFITNDTKLYQMSNFYGCSDNSSMLADFVVTNETGRFSDMMAFAMIRNFSMFARGQLYISCGVNLCKRSCQLNCDEDESERLRGFSSVVLKKMVMRASGVATPSTFRLFSDGPQRTKRSVREVLSDVLHASGSFLSNLIKGSNDSLSTMEAPTEGNPSISELDSERNKSNPEVEFEVNTLSIGIVTTATSEQTVLNQSMPSANFDVRNVSAEMYSSERYLETTTVNKSTIRKIFSGHALPNSAVAEVFVFVVFCLMTASYICLVHSKVDKRKCAPVYK